MKKTIGNPKKINQNLISIINRTKINDFYLKNPNNFKDRILKEIKTSDTVLDIGKAMREKHKLINCNSVETLDVNDYDDYPDIICDICSEISELENRYDKIICIAIL